MLTHDAKPANQDWLKNLVGAVEQDPRIAGAFGRHIAYPGALPYTKRDLQLHFDHFLTWPLVIRLEDRARYDADEGYRQVLHYFSDNNACLRKSIWEKLPYPEVDFAEDQLWAQKVIEAGYLKAFANDAVVYHSHDYTLKDTMRRSFDEARALRRLFGYKLCPSIGHMIYQIVACTKRDLAYARTLPKGEQNLRLKLRTPFIHFCKQLGFYLGQRSEKSDMVMMRWFSLDNALKRQ